jgi:hypothetical protein
MKSEREEVLTVVTINIQLFYTHYAVWTAHSLPIFLGLLAPENGGSVLL